MLEGRLSSTLAQDAIGSLTLQIMREAEESFEREMGKIRGGREAGDAKLFKMASSGNRSGSAPEQHPVPPPGRPAGFCPEPAAKELSFRGCTLLSILLPGLGPSQTSYLRALTRPSHARHFREGGPGTAIQALQNWINTLRRSLR